MLTRIFQANTCLRLRFHQKGHHPSLQPKRTTTNFRFNQNGHQPLPSLQPKRSPSFTSTKKDHRLSHPPIKPPVSVSIKTVTNFRFNQNGHQPLPSLQPERLVATKRSPAFASTKYITSFVPTQRLPAFVSTRRVTNLQCRLNQKRRLP